MNKNIKHTTMLINEEFEDGMNSFTYWLSMISKYGVWHYFVPFESSLVGTEWVF